jgi:hypothetical protein
MTGAHPTAFQERFYKVIKGGINAENIVGMYKVNVHDGMNLISLPLLPFSIALADVIGIHVIGADNEGDSDRVCVWNGTNYEFVLLVDGVGAPFNGQWYTGNAQTSITLGADQGAWLQIRPDIGPLDLYLLDELFESNRTIPVGVGMNQVGACYPVSVQLADCNLWESGLTGADNEAAADRIWSGATDHY